MKKAVVLLVVSFIIGACKSPLEDFTFSDQVNRSATSGQTVQIESLNFPGSYVRHINYNVRIDSQIAPIEDSHWTIVPGLADSSLISFESVNFPGSYLRHSNNTLYLAANDGTQLFKNDATFSKVSGLADVNASSFKSFNFPDRYIRHQNGILKIDQISSDLDRNDATFHLRSLNSPLEPLYTGTPNADPSIIRVGETYISVESQHGAMLCIRSADSPSNLMNANPIAIYEIPAGFSDMWAPEIVRLHNRYHIYFAMNPGSGHRMYMISSDDPIGPWSSETKIILPDDKWAIDGIPFYYSNQLWFTWSGWQGDTNIEQNIYICRMATLSNSTGSRFIISQPRETWEVLDSPKVNEGPQPIIDPNGQLHIVYSFNGSWGENYSLGDLRLRQNGDPTYVWDWYKSNGSLFGSNSSLMMPGWDSTLYYKGVGHHSFVLVDGDINTSPPSGSAFPMVYHGVPIGEYPSDFWGARKWISGSFMWWGNTTYTRGSESDTGWSLKFFE